MTKKSDVVEAAVVENNSTPIVQKTPVQVVTAQQDNFRKQLEVAKANMTKLQQQFDAQKTMATKLEGALESLDLLLKDLSK
jgi:hypothetical protein